MEEDDILAALDEAYSPKEQSGSGELSERAKEYLSVLNPEQYEAVVHEGGSLLILAGAGSGKTRVVTTKIAYLIGERHVDPRSILAVSFTKKAAKEMHERAVLLEPRAESAQIRTFHSFGAWFLRLNAEAAGLAPTFTVYDDDDMSTLVGKAVPGLTKQQANRYAHKISLAKDYGLLPDSPELADIDTDPQFPTIYALYQKRLRETGNVDFGDLILLPAIVLRESETIRHRMHQRFKIIMVDEYQDTNVAQFQLLQVLSGVQEGNDSYVCVVGDDDQSIYKFRGAEIKNILNFQKHFPNTTVVRLERNYRSKAEILRIADSVVKNNDGRLGKTLIAERGAGKKPVLAFLPNQDEETQFCADLIELTHKKGVPYMDWAILYRTNAQSLGFESEFLHRKIPYTVVGSLKFYEREEIKDVLALLALIANPRDEIAFRRVVNKPARGLGDTSQDKIVLAARENLVAPSQSGEDENEGNGENSNADSYNLIETSRRLAPSMSKKAREGLEHFVEIMDGFAELLAKPAVPTEVQDKLSVLVEQVAEKSGLKEYHETKDEVAGTQKVANMQELANNAVLYPCTMEGLLEFLDNIELDRTLASDEEDNPDSVTLITLHNTKGLEFNRVIMTGMELGLFPRPEKTGEELEEERRLCYVGITRAKDELYLTSCAMRRMYGRTEYMQISPFLLEVGQGNVKVIGHKPYGYRLDEDADSTALHGGDFGENGLSHPAFANDPLAQKYCKGAKIYHDDYGYGIISAGTMSEDDEYVITVQFENGGSKKFIPKYQSHSLMVVKD
ncbi:MAG: UvrD-helicase domain-containing protein [Treponema sp.]|nr:UvrD-helicase domain-containing protein [Treponema sp.]